MAATSHRPWREARRRCCGRKAVPVSRYPAVANRWMALERDRGGGVGDTSLWLWNGGGGGASGSSSSSCPRGSAACRRGKGRMDPNRIIQALKGTIDPKLRIAAENELNQVRGADGPGRDPPAACPAPAPPRLTLAAERYGVAWPRWQGRGAGGGAVRGGCRGAPPPSSRGGGTATSAPQRGAAGRGSLRRCPPLARVQRSAGLGHGRQQHPPPERAFPRRLSAAAPLRRRLGRSAAGPGGGGLAAGGTSGCRDPRGGVCRCETCGLSEPPGGERGELPRQPVARAVGARPLGGIAPILSILWPWELGVRDWSAAI